MQIPGIKKAIKNQAGGSERVVRARAWAITSIGVLVLMGGLSARAATIIDPLDDPTVSAADYHQLAAAYPAVGEVLGSGFSGSGVLIGDRWVLTAGHVAGGKVGGSFLIGGNSYSVASVTIHPSYTLSPLTNDLGLLLLSTAVGNVAAARMVQFSDSLLPMGIEATWVGHGFTGTGRTGAMVPLELRAFTNVIDAMGPAFEGLPATSFVADFDAPDGSGNAPGSSTGRTLLEGNLAPGDSGGGVFFDIGGEGYLIGINSYRSTLDAVPEGTNSRYGAISGASDLQQFHSWIEQETGISAVPIPEPSCLVLLAGSLWLFCFRRKSS